MTSLCHNFGRVAPGDIKYVDQNHDNVIDANDSYPVGHTSIPEWNYALNLGCKWKGFDFSMLFQGVANRDLYLYGDKAFIHSKTMEPLRHWL